MCCGSTFFLEYKGRGYVCDTEFHFTKLMQINLNYVCLFVDSMPICKTTGTEMLHKGVK